MSRACCSVPTDVTTTRTEGATFAGLFTGNKVREARRAVKRGRPASFRNLGSVFGHGLESLKVGNREPLRAGDYDVFLSPAAHHANRGLDRGRREVRDVPAGECKRNRGARALAVAHACRQHEKESRNALLDRTRQIREPPGDLELPQHQPLKKPARHFGMAVDRREELALGNTQDRGRLEGDGRGRKPFAFEERDGSDRLADAEESEDHVALRRRLEELPLLRVQALEERDGVEVGEGGSGHGESIERCGAGDAVGAERGRSVARRTWAQSRSPAVAKIPVVPTRR